MRQQIVRAAHDELEHFSIQKTLENMAENYWFSHMHDYITRYIKSCVPCIFNKAPTGKQPGFLHPIPKEPVRYHTIHVDHLRPFRKSTSGKSYIVVAVDATSDDWRANDFNL